MANAFLDGWFTRAVACAAVLSATQGCNGDDPASTGPLYITGVVQNLELNKERQLYDGVPGVRICIYPENTICGTSDSSGTYRIDGVPENSELVLSYQHADFVPTLRMLVTRENNVILLAPSIMGSTELAEQLAEDYMFEAIDGRGSLQFFAMRPTMGVLQLQELEGFTVALKNLDGSDVEVHDDITYAGAEGVPDPNLEASSRRGVGGIANIEPGEYELVFSHPDLDCSQKLEEAGWVTDTDRATRFEIFPGWVTGMVGIVCQRAE